MTGLPGSPPSDAPVPDFGDVGSHEELLDWSRAYAGRIVAATDLAVTLDRLDWEVSTRAKRRAAAVVHPRVAETAVGEAVDWSRREEGPGGPPRCTVRLTWDAARQFDRRSWARTVRHELVHVEQFQRYGTTGHGATFRTRAEALETTVRCERFAEPKYVLSCPDCEEVVARRYRDCKLVRRHDEYRSSCCGASLSLHRTGARSQ